MIKFRDKLGSLMFYPSVDKIKWRESITALFDQGIEINFDLRPHITLLYGFDNSMLDLNQLKNLTETFLSENPIDLVADRISIFDNNSKIVKIDVLDLNGNLTKFNQLLRTEFESFVDYPIYAPHITIGVIKSPLEITFDNHIELNKFGFKSLNNGIIRYYDGLKISSIISSI